MGAIIGLNSSSAKNVAPATDLEGLYNYLNSTLGKNFIINGYGEALGPSAARPWTLTGTGSVTQFVQGEENVFIDYCGWPMSYLVNVDGAVTNIGPNGFQTFAKNIGYDWLGAANFQASNKTGADGYIFPFVRGFNQSGALNGLYLPHGTFRTSGGTWTLNGGGYAAVLGIHRPGIGWYFWGSHYHSFSNTVFGPAGYPHTVPSNVYGAFIEAVVHGQSTVTGSGFSMTISHEPYTVKATSPQKNTTGASSPYSGGSPGPSGSSSSGSPNSAGSSGCPSGYVMINGICQRSTSVGTMTRTKSLVAVGLLAVGIGGVWYAGSQEGWWTDGKRNETPR